MWKAAVGGYVPCAGAIGDLALTSTGCSVGQLTTPGAFWLEEALFACPAGAPSAAQVQRAAGVAGARGGVRADLPVRGAAHAATGAHAPAGRSRVRAHCRRFRHAHICTRLPGTPADL